MHVPLFFVRISKLKKTGTNMENHFLKTVTEFINQNERKIAHDGNSGPLHIHNNSSLDVVCLTLSSLRHQPTNKQTLSRAQIPHVTE